MGTFARLLHASYTVSHEEQINQLINCLNGQNNVIAQHASIINSQNNEINDLKKRVLALETRLTSVLSR